MTGSSNSAKLIYEDIFLEEVFAKKGINIIDRSELENLLCQENGYLEDLDYLKEDDNNTYKIEI